MCDKCNPYRDGVVLKIGTESFAVPLDQLVDACREADCEEATVTLRAKALLQLVAPDRPDSLFATWTCYPVGYVCPRCGSLVPWANPLHACSVVTITDGTTTSETTITITSPHVA